MRRPPSTIVAARRARCSGASRTADFDVVVRDADGAPVVIRNAPFTRDGTPMPTRYWLVDPELEPRRWPARGRRRRAGGRGGRRPATMLAAAHAAYAAERDAAIAADHDGPRPCGGVGGHAHRA